MEPKKPWKLELAPGALDLIPPEEREEVGREIVRLLQSGEIFEGSKPLDLEKLKEEEPEVYEQIMKGLSEMEGKGEE